MIKNKNEKILYMTYRLMHYMNYLNCMFGPLHLFHISSCSLMFKKFQVGPLYY